VSTVRAPPVATLFPYTTLFRSGAVVPQWCNSLPAETVPENRASRRDQRGCRTGPAAERAGGPQAPDVRDFEALGTRRGNPDQARSEEHTSELQSRENLVCRLLL